MKWQREKSTRVADLVAAAGGVDGIILATDPDREGEAIALACCDSAWQQ